MTGCFECDYQVEGECRRFPPPYPKVNETMGCGEGKPKGADEVESLIAASGDGGKAVNVARTSVLSK